MARRKAGERAAPHRLIAEVVSDPQRPPEVQVLTGLVGDDPEDGFLRLYESPATDSYFRVRIDDVVTREDDETGGGFTMLFVKREANVQLVRIESRTFQAEFLQGGLRELRDLPAPGGAGERSMTQPATTTEWFCPQPSSGCSNGCSFVCTVNSGCATSVCTSSSTCTMRRCF